MPGTRVHHLRARRGEAAYTLLELMIVVALFSMMAVFAFPSLQSLIPRYRLNRAVAEFAANAQSARVAAVAEGREYRLCLADKDSTPSAGAPQTNSGSYRIDYGNAMSNSTVWTNETQVVMQQMPGADYSYYAGVSLQEWTPLGGPGIGNADCVVFSPKGWLANPAEDFDGGFIYVQFRNKAANPDDDVRTVRFGRGSSIQTYNGALDGDSGDL